jgi:hypothetical protein
MQISHLCHYTFYLWEINYHSNHTIHGTDYKWEHDTQPEFSHTDVL